jgi:flagellar biosynthetic protein FliS
MNKNLGMYKEMQVSGEINQGSKKKVLMMMYDAVIVNLNEAISAMKNQNLPVKLQKIDKTLSIIEKGLIMSLSKDGAKEVAESLELFYEYASSTIVLANAKNDVDLLTEIKAYFLDLKKCWEQVKE